MAKKVLVAVLVATCLFGCAGVQITEKNVSIFMAKNVTREDGPIGIADKFPLEGKVYAYVNFKWDAVESVAGQRHIKAKWYSGDKLVSVQEGNWQMGRPPYHVWFAMTRINLGVGKARVEIFSDGTLVGNKSFEIVEKL